MITNSVIKEIYRRYRKRPKSIDDLEVELLFGRLHPGHGIELEGNQLRILSIPQESPFHDIALSAICKILDFEKHVAIVMHSSILFLNKENDGVSVHIKPYKPSIWIRLREMLSRKSKK